MTMATGPRAQQPSSCPAGWLPTGHVMPVEHTVRQDHYCRRAVGVVRFTYNLCVATHQFCRINRLPWLSWQDPNKAVIGWGTSIQEAQNNMRPPHHKLGVEVERPDA